MIINVHLSKLRRIAGASFGPPESRNQMASLSVQLFLHSSRQCRRACPGMSFSLKIAPSLGGSGLPSNICFLEPIQVHNPDGISIGSAVFAQKSSVIRYLMACLSLKIAPSHGGSGSPSNTWFFEHTRVFHPNGISIGSAVFAKLTTVTNRQTTLLRL